ncbi:hypothetical protein FISHEDRAFT_65218 [Fistulina hepatica ATCC 64428]|uniref:Uncharacterized protein n=1 Tax=Fistulina hepatica ATCC 64428 TaxID=1128425 RepID=A0A0D7AHR0_9AGAR|nr:hypothetical protein FISHEDRAFT_65218 [Fistulina hepatica ATCC 64428]
MVVVIGADSRTKMGSYIANRTTDKLVHVHDRIYCCRSGSSPAALSEGKDNPSAGMIVAGWEKEVGPSVYNIPLGNGLFRQPWTIGGISGSMYVYGYCDTWMGSR